MNYNIILQLTSLIFTVVIGPLVIVLLATQNDSGL